jgi:hypothetical protein
MTHTLSACLVAAALMIPQAVVAGDAPQKTVPQDAPFALPTIPYIETIPWLTAGRPRKTLDASLYHRFGVPRLAEAVTPPVVRYSAMEIPNVALQP